MRIVREFRAKLQRSCWTHWKFDGLVLSRRSVAKADQQRIGLMLRFRARPLTRSDQCYAWRLGGVLMQSQNLGDSTRCNSTRALANMEAHTLAQSLTMNRAPQLVVAAPS